VNDGIRPAVVVAGVCAFSSFTWVVSVGVGDSARACCTSLRPMPLPCASAATNSASMLLPVTAENAIGRSVSSTSTHSDAVAR